MARAPRATGARYQIVGAVDHGMVRGAEDQSGGKGSAFVVSEKTLEPAGVQFHVAVEDGDPLRCGVTPADVHGPGEAEVLAGADDTAAVAPGHFDSVVGRSVIDHNHLGERRRLGVQGPQQTVEQVGAVMDGNDSGYHLYTCDCNEMVSRSVRFE